MKILHGLVGFCFSVSLASGGELSVKEDEKTITILNGDATVLVYNKAPTPDAAENDPVYTRTGYIHPVFTPSGKQVTDDFAPDHPHQHGLYFAWTTTSSEGRAPAFWNETETAGTEHGNLGCPG